MHCIDLALTSLPSCDKGRFNFRGQNSGTHHLEILLMNPRWVQLKRVLKTFWPVQTNVLIEKKIILISFVEC